MKVKNYVIRHKAGVKANQIDEFDFDSHHKLTLGRMATNDVAFDSDQDFMVSREHARIESDPENPLDFKIIDNNSKNGVYKNGKKIKESAPLTPGDEIQLGTDGPIFIFDLDPRPRGMMAETREIGTSKATQAHSVTPEEESEPQKVGIGKQTFERALAVEQSKSNRKLLMGLAAALLIVGSVIFVFWKKSQEEAKKNAALLESGLDDMGKKVNDINNKPLPETAMPAEEIVVQNTERLVQIEVNWQLYDPETSDEVWHKYVKVKDRNGNSHDVAAYITNSAGEIEPYLVTKDRVGVGLPVGQVGWSGSGFVVSDDGFILTARHLAAAWKTRYVFPRDAFPGVLVSADGKVIGEVDASDVGGWVPSEASNLNGRLLKTSLEGRNTSLKTVFSNTALRRTTTVEAISDNHDAALLKVAVPQKLSFVELLDNYDEIKPGQTVTVMGFPGVSPQMLVARKSTDVFKPHTEITTVPVPTVTPGNIGKLIKWSPESSTLYSLAGDCYQLTVNATGAGNSGGPLFDNKGRVIGIFYAGTTDRDGIQITFAVPIKYGLELMGHKKMM